MFFLQVGILLDSMIFHFFSLASFDCWIFGLLKFDGCRFNSLCSNLIFWTKTKSCTMPISQETSNFDEISMKQSLIFSDCLKVLIRPSQRFLENDKSSSITYLLSAFDFQDLKNLRAQLYSAAEYFELSYTNDDQKQMWVSWKAFQKEVIKAFLLLVLVY